MNEDDSQSDPHPEAGVFHNQMTRNSGPEDGDDTYFLQMPLQNQLVVANSYKII